MPRFFRLQVDVEALTDELFAFVTDPSASRNERQVVDELHDLAPETIPVLEYMILDGVDERHTSSVPDVMRSLFCSSM